MHALGDVWTRTARETTLVADRCRLVAGSRDGNVHVWDMRCAKGVAAGMAGPTVALRPVLSLKACLSSLVIKPGFRDIFSCGGAGAQLAEGWSAQLALVPSLQIVSACFRDEDDLIGHTQGVPYWQAACGQCLCEHAGSQRVTEGVQLHTSPAGNMLMGPTTTVQSIQGKGMSVADTQPHAGQARASAPATPQSACMGMLAAIAHASSIIHIDLDKPAVHRMHTSQTGGSLAAAACQTSPTSQRRWVLATACTNVQAAPPWPRPGKVTAQPLILS